MLASSSRDSISVVGYVLPLRRRWTSNPGWHWESGRWFLRPEHLFLIPGDSPIGYRLPLDSLPWVTPDGLPLHLRAGSSTSNVHRLPPKQMYRRARPFGVSQNRRVGLAAPVGESPCRRNVACPIPSVDSHGALRRAAGRPIACVHAAGRARRRITSI